jgi:hypothetical protein
MTRPALCIVALLALFADGCGEEAAREPGASPTPPPRAAPGVITEADSGESFTLAQGAETNLRLTSDRSWSEPTVSGEAVELTRVDYFQDPGFSEWVVQAVGPGTATIAARGGPLRFQVEIVVAP